MSSFAVQTAIADPASTLQGPPTLAEGQAVFWKYSALIYSALGHFSLAGGFSAPKLEAVMRETNYLTSGARDATHKRLLETSLHVIDVSLACSRQRHLVAPRS